MRPKSNELKPCPFCGCEDAKMQCVDSIYYIQCMGCNARATSVFEEEKDITIKSWNTRPKPSIMWPSRKDAIANGNGKGKADQWSLGWNAAIDACQAAVEAAGLGYGLDEENFKNLKMVRDLIDGMLYKGHIIHEEKTAMLKALDIALKLAERELITRTTT